ncbi:MAG TPA: extradiol ring-cleavage dioxygenase [Bacilli bacterium]|nr:extradiol ring-cleavage dioxygenase [Bacilli bacterium]
MNPFVFACITPHGSEIIEALSGHNPELMAKTRQSMEILGRDMEAAKPDAIVVLTPHGVRISEQFAITNCERMVGELEEEDGSRVEMERFVDRELAWSIYEEAALAGVRIGSINFAVSEGPYSCLPLDWGALVPLYFMPDVPVVVITTSYELEYEDHVRLGKHLAKAVQASGKRVGLIASCDWSHAHAADGPYGYHPAAAKLDAQVVELIRENKLEDMMALDEGFVEDAKPDGIWQALVLAGAIPQAARDVEFLSYEVPTYFGLMCAAYYNRSSK